MTTKLLDIQMLPVTTKPTDLLGDVNFIMYKKLCSTFHLSLDFKARGPNNEISVSKAPVDRYRTTTTREDKAKAPHLVPETSLAFAPAPH